MTKNGAKALRDLLCWLTCLWVGGQLIFAGIHHQLSEVMDSLVKSALIVYLLNPVILFPVMQYILVNLSLYVLLILWILYISATTTELLKRRDRFHYFFGLSIWLFAIIWIFLLNAYFYPNSFFAGTVTSVSIPSLRSISLGVSIFFTVITTLALIFNLLKKRRLFLTLSFLAILFLNGVFYLSDHWPLKPEKVSFSLPNIVLIGIDSLRPDVIDYNGGKALTPTIDAFLQTSKHFSNAYTPLARTFPAWMSILTAHYPKQSGARMNLIHPQSVDVNDGLIQRLKTAGYETIYGTDESRYAAITKEYGFDQQIGPKPGGVEFLLANLSDFPLVNISLALPISRFLFPYQYGNRAAFITYRHSQFLSLVKNKVANRPQKPLFLAVHLCTAHWPFLWGSQPFNGSVEKRYQMSVERADRQVKNLLSILEQLGILQHSLLILFSDHGVTLGSPGDRLLTENHYQGDAKQIKVVSRYRLNSADENTMDFKNDFSINTSYGQGTDVLSLKQNKVLLAIKYNDPEFKASIETQRVSLLDLAPTILDYLKLPPLHHSDGISLLNLSQTKDRPFYIETADSIGEMETDNIKVTKVLNKLIGAYDIDQKTGRIFVTPAAVQSSIKARQRAVIWNDWMLSHFPSGPAQRLNTKHDGTVELETYQKPDYFVLLNLKTLDWGVGIDSRFAKQAPLEELTQRFKAFYGDEVDF